jgi:Bacterial Ig-like domain (group 3)/FG-GAP-like repeat
MGHQRLLPVCFPCGLAILVSALMLAQSNSGPVINQPNGIVSSIPRLPARKLFKHGRTAGSRAAATLVTPQGSGLNFAPTVSYPSGSLYTNSVAVGDVNGDGKPDLVVANNCLSYSSCSSAGVSVLLGNGDGTFQTAVTYGAGVYEAQSVALADVNGDGKLDILVTNYCTVAGNEGCTNTAGTVGVLLGNGDGTFQTAVFYGSGGFYANSVAVADVNGDGNPDLVVANQCASVPDGPCSANGSVGILLGNGTGTFQTAVTYGSGGYSGPKFGDVYEPLSVVIADVNRDGKPDVLVTNYCGGASACTGDGTVSVLLGNGDGTFQTAVAYDSGGLEASAVAVADVNADGNPDILVANGCSNSSGSCPQDDGTVGVLLGNGDGTFQAAVTYDAGGQIATSVAVADVNGDGKPDLAVAVVCPENGCNIIEYGTVDVLLGNGDGTFQAAVDYDSGGDPADSVAIHDVNGDGKPDLLVANYCAWVGDDGYPCATGGQVGVLLNTSADPTTTSVASSLNPSSLGQTVTFTATVTAQQYFYAGLPTGTVNFLNGTTSLGSSVLNSGGSATFTTSILAAGTQSITAAYSGATDFASSTSPVLSQVVQTPIVVLSPTSLNFAYQATGTTSAPQSVALMNSGSLALTITSIGITGTNSAAFAQTNNCGSSLAAGATCQILTTFTPSAQGTYTASISIADNAGGSPQTVALNGSAAPVPVVTLSPSSISFPAQYVGTSGLPQTVTLTNTGNDTLTIDSVNTTAADFGELSSCGNSVPQGASCQIGVFFDPTASGTRTGALTLTDNAPGSPQSLPLTGAGQDFSLAPSSQTTANVSPGQSATYMLSVVPGGGFSQTVVFACGGAPAQSTCSVSPSQIKLGGTSGSTATVTITTTGNMTGLTLPRGGSKLDRPSALLLVLSNILALSILLSLAGWRRPCRARLHYAMVFLSLVAIGFTMSACGSSSGGSSGSGTQAGTYNLTVTGSYSSGTTTLAHTVKLVLVVQ